MEGGKTIYEQLNGWRVSYAGCLLLPFFCVESPQCRGTRTSHSCQVSRRAERGKARSRRLQSWLSVKTRRNVEQRLRGGEISSLVSTSALELGIDIGEIDACVIAGYPGSMQKFRQQAGRAGRQKKRGWYALFPFQSTRSIHS